MKLRISGGIKQPTASTLSPINFKNTQINYSALSQVTVNVPEATPEGFNNCVETVNGGRTKSLSGHIHYHLSLHSRSLPFLAILLVDLGHSNDVLLITGDMWPLSARIRRIRFVFSPCVCVCVCLHGLRNCGNDPWHLRTVTLQSFSGFAKKQRHRVMHRGCSQYTTVTYTARARTIRIYRSTESWVTEWSEPRS